MTNNLETLKALALAATPGEYHILNVGNRVYIMAGNRKIFSAHKTIHESPDDERESNAAFIAAANPKTVIELIEVMKMMGEALKSCDDAGGVHELYHDASLVEKALARYEAIKEGKK